MSARRDLERSQVWGDVHGAHIECQRGEPTFVGRFGGAWEVAMPRLVLRSGQWDVEAELDELVIGSEDVLAECGNGGVADQAEEAPDLFWMHSEVVPLRTPADCAARVALSDSKGRLEILVKAVDPGRLEAAGKADDAVSVKVGPLALQRCQRDRGGGHGCLLRHRASGLRFTALNTMMHHWLVSRTTRIVTAVRRRAEDLSNPRRVAVEHHAGCSLVPESRL